MDVLLPAQKRRKSMSKPSAIIITLEDSVPLFDQQLIVAYLRTTYRVLQPLFDLRIGVLNKDFDLWLAEQRVERYTFITAWNPFSREASLEENHRRNEQLEKELTARSKQVLPAVGTGDGDWPPERSFCALDLSREDALLLGRQFEQNALVFGRTGAVPELWWLPEIGVL